MEILKNIWNASNKLNSFFFSANLYTITKLLTCVIRCQWVYLLYLLQECCGGREEEAGSELARRRLSIKSLSSFRADSLPNMNPYLKSTYHRIKSINKLKFRLKDIRRNCAINSVGRKITRRRRPRKRLQLLQCVREWSSSAFFLLYNICVHILCVGAKFRRNILLNLRCDCAGSGWLSLMPEWEGERVTEFCGSQLHRQREYKEGTSGRESKGNRAWYGPNKGQILKNRVVCI